PRLFEYIYRQRDKHSVTQKLNLAAKEAVLHVSSMYPREYGCTAIVVPLAIHPVNRNGVVVYDLRYDPGPLLDRTAEEIRERLYTPTDELPEGVERIPLKVVHINKCPVVVPLNTLDSESADRLGIDITQSMRNLEQLQRAESVEDKVQTIFIPRDRPDHGDPDHALYSGGFFSDADRARMVEVRSRSPAELAEFTPPFQDSRLPEMLFRYRARNYPETLSVGERERWEEYRFARLIQPDGGGSIALAEYREKLKALGEGQELTSEKLGLLRELEEYADAIAAPRVGSSIRVCSRH
ncbi:MAG: exodeoxyribonuclease I, partial [Gammaproteobacteria bacterium]|nr:exodeoxyribonuclease I [Gammaproteobacteria bacterium]